jgi:hypothetical protein
MFEELFDGSIARARQRERAAGPRCTPYVASWSLPILLSQSAIRFQLVKIWSKSPSPRLMN